MSKPQSRTTRIFSLRWKLVLPFFALSLVTWLLAAQILGRSFEQTIEAQGRADVHQMATSTARHLELKMTYLGQEASALGDTGALMVGKRSMGQAISEVESEGMLEAFKGGGGTTLSPDLIRVIDRTGKLRIDLRRNVIEMLHSVDDKAVLAATSKEGDLGTIVTLTGAPVGYVVGTSRIVLHGKQLAVFMIGMSLNRKMLQEIGISGDYDVFVVGRSGVLASTGPAADTPALQRQVMRQGSSEVSVNGKNYLLASVPLVAPHTPGLRVVAAVPTARLTAAANAGRMRAWIILGIGLIAFVALGLWLSTHLTRPVRAVTEAAEQLASGDLTARAPVMSSDEIGTLATAFNTMGDELSERAERLDDAFNELRRLSETDALTGLLNHRAIHERLRLEIARAQRYDLRVTILVADVDNFKLINDTYGHPAGDEVIRQIAAVIAGSVRQTDVVGRHGGDEFTIILTEIGSDEASVVADKLQGAMHKHPMVTPDGLNVPLRLSMGMASYPANGKEMNELLAFADTNLYMSKRRGGDRITRGDEEDRLEALVGGFSMLDSMVTAVDNKDRYTRRHSEEVTRLAVGIAEEIGMSEESQRVLRVAGLLHDVGKIGVPDAVLRKPGRLTAAEYEVVKHHATLGATIIQGIADEEDIRTAVGSHHERWDGEGYPSGISGHDIPLLGRILAVADSLSAMTSDRPYRQALSVDESVAELRLGSGVQFDPELVEVTVRVFERHVTEDSHVGAATARPD